MSALLWIDTAKGEAIDLGNPLRLLTVFGEMGRAAGDRYGEYRELFGVPDATMEQDDVDPGWLARVKAQAARFRAEFASHLSPDAASVLSALLSD